jgi:hypothetical protein
MLMTQKMHLQQYIPRMALFSFAMHTYPHNAYQVLEHLTSHTKVLDSQRKCVIASKAKLAEQRVQQKKHLCTLPVTCRGGVVEHTYHVGPNVSKKDDVIGEVPQSLPGKPHHDSRAHLPMPRQ